MAILIHYRSLLADFGFVLAFSALHVLDQTVAEYPPGVAPAWSLLLSVPTTFALLLRRKLPWVAMLLPLVAATTLTLMHLSIGALNLVILVALYSICVRASLWASILAVGLALAYPVSQMVGLPLADGLLNIVGALVNLVMVVGWARAMRLGRQRAVQLERTITLLDSARDQIASDAAVVERARIAREFHDIVSHNLSVVALRAGVARALVDRDPGHARETLRELEQLSSEALDEMRTMLDALRDDGEVSDEVGLEQRDRRPAPRLDGVDELLNSVQESGVVWRLERRGSIRGLGSGVEMTAYRIVQEAITNVLKHAGPGYARVLLDYGNANLHVEITNHSQESVSTAVKASPPQVSRTPGHGLVGLRERVALLGGVLTAHPIPGGFHLAAVLPCGEPANTA